MKVLLTGIGGFVGSHVAEHILATTDWDIVGIVRAGTRRDRIPTSDRVRLINHDLQRPLTPSARNTMGNPLRDIGPINYVINIAAQSDVEMGLANPATTIQNNVAATVNLLEWARVAKPDVFLQSSTVEVYGPAHGQHRHREWEPAIPSNPYAASKAAAEAIAISYWRSYGVPVVITNTMNIFGERQQPSRVIPTVIRKILTGEPMPIYGSRGVPGSRFYIHARNQADALLFLLKTQPPQRYPEYDRPSRFHVVGEREIDNVTMAQQIAGVMGKTLNYALLEAYDSRPGHDLRYALDGHKLEVRGWKVPVSFEDSLRRTVEWTLQHPEWLGTPIPATVGVV